MNILQRISARKEIIKMRRYRLACQELDRWLACDPKAVLIIKHIDDFANDRAALWPDKLRRQLMELEREGKGSELTKLLDPIRPPHS